MKPIIAVIMLAGVAWLYPLLAEGTGRPCGALATRAARLHAANDSDFNNPIAMALVSVLGDSFVSQMVNRRYPSTPPQLVCVGYYWYLTVDPSSADRVWRELQSGMPPSPQTWAADLLQLPAKGRPTDRP